MNSLFSYIPGDTFVHHLNPITKLFAAFFICIVAAITVNHIFELVLILLLLVLAQVVGGLRRCLRVITALGALACIAWILQILFVRTGTIWFEFGILRITQDGFMSGLLVVEKVVCMVLPLTLAFMATPINDLTNALVLRCHLPYKYAFTITTTIRFIPIFSEEMNEIMEAQRSRGVEFDTRNVFKRLRLMVPLCVPLLVTSVKRTDDIAIAAEIRGFDLRTRTSGWKKYPFHANDLVAFLLCLLLLAAMIVVGIFFY